MAGKQGPPAIASPGLQVELLAYAPTEFFHCQHCEFVWNQLEIGERFHAEQRTSALLPPELMAEYTTISDWVVETSARFGNRVSIKVVDAASLEGVIKSIRYRTRHFPAFIIGGQRIGAFDRPLIEAELLNRLEAS